MHLPYGLHILLCMAGSNVLPSHAIRSSALILAAYMHCTYAGAFLVDVGRHGKCVELDKEALGVN